MVTHSKESRRLLVGVKAGVWQKNACAYDKADVDWFLLIPPKSMGAAIGITRDGFWAVSTPHGIRKVHVDDWGVPLLIALEYPLVDLKTLIVKNATAFGIDENIAEQFPFKEAVAASFDAGSYWIPLALSWLADDPSLLTTDIKLRLQQVSENKNVAQKVRQEAKRLGHLPH
jgi:hypothetical protein